MTAVLCHPGHPSLARRRGQKGGGGRTRALRVVVRLSGSGTVKRAIPDARAESVGTRDLDHADHTDHGRTPALRVVVRLSGSGTVERAIPQLYPADARAKSVGPRDLDHANTRLGPRQYATWTTPTTVAAEVLVYGEPGLMPRSKTPIPAEREHCAKPRAIRPPPENRTVRPNQSSTGQRSSA
jgi:hypothetical protein